MFILLAIVVVMDAISFGWSLVNNETSDITIKAFYVGFSSYVLVLAARSVNQISIDSHAESILHLTVLTTLATTLLGSSAILPDTRPITLSLETVTVVNFLKIFSHVKLVLYLLVCFTAFTSPQGPRLRLPPEKIYAEKTVQAITNVDEENVCGIIGKLHRLCSVIS